MPIETDDYFLSASNPMATSEQRDAEDTAVRIMSMPAMQRARGVVAHMFRLVLEKDVGDEFRKFDNFIEEYMFHFALRAVNSDPNYPKIVRFQVPAHHWFGRDVPGSRWGGDCPDYIMRHVGVGDSARYELHGRATCSERPIVNYALMELGRAAHTNLALLDSLDMEFEPNGDFTLTLDPSPADGRKNHIQTKPGAWQLWIRDGLRDWNTQTANALRIHRLDPPERGPLTDEEVAEKGARQALDGIYYEFFLLRTSMVLPDNRISTPVSSAAFGGLPSQYGSDSNLWLEEDEALIVTGTAAHALFRDIVLVDSYWMTFDYRNHQSNMAIGHMAADEDGRFTFVISHRDPSVHNWLDTCGNRRMRLNHRWQSFDRAVPHEAPTLTGRKVKFADLEKELPSGVRRIDAAGRTRQIELRQDAIRARFLTP